MDDGHDLGTWPDPATAERLLRVIAPGGCPADPGALQEVADARVFALLRLLTAAARGGDVDPEREQAALAAFRAARRAGGARQGRRLVVSGRSAKALAGGLAAVFAVSGVAVAAGTGVLPGPFRGGAFHAGPLAAGGTAGSADGPAAAVPQSTLPPAPGPDASHSAAPPPADDESGHHHGDPRTPHHPGTHKPSEKNHQATVKALCRSYTAATRRGGHIDPWLIVRLQGEAGRKDRIADYCRGLLAHRHDDPGATTNPLDPAGSNGPTAPTTPTASSTYAPPSPSATTTDSASDSADSPAQGQGEENATHDRGTTVK